MDTMKKERKYGVRTATGRPGIRAAAGLVCVLLTACMEAGVLHDGDLIFQANEDGGFVDAIENVTDGAWSHVGIIQLRADGVYVLEASPGQGVVRTPLAAFLDASAHDAAGRAVVKVCRIRDLSAAEAAAALGRAEVCLGRPYDYAFDPGTEALYCSELVYESFRKEDGSYIFKANPMSFKGPDGKTDPYWIRYYERMERDIPEGVPGTNPNDLSRETVLVPVAWPAE